jgi:hypothetical protein
LKRWPNRPQRMIVRHELLKRHVIVVEGTVRLPFTHHILVSPDESNIQGNDNYRKRFVSSLLGKRRKSPMSATNDKAIKVLVHLKKVLVPDFNQGRQFSGGLTVAF